MNLALVITAFNRDFELKRLLCSLEATFPLFPKSIQLTLIISIDKNENLAVYQLARDFYFPLGDKRVIEHQENLGLRNHILFSAGLVKSFDALIMLEDDLMVSKHMWSYIVQSLNFFKEDSRIAQISLYTQVYNETAAMTFASHDDGFDNFFLKVPSSWGQIWTARQWQEFEDWLRNEFHESYFECCPPDVKRWPATSWKKLFFTYIIAKDKYVVYPRKSLTTNFLSTGTHHKGGGYYLQASLLAYRKELYRFSSIVESESIYDHFLERCDQKFIQKVQRLSGVSSIELDLYGQKNITQINSKYVITCRDVNAKAIKYFPRQLHPHELNLLQNNFDLNNIGCFKVYETEKIKTLSLSIVRQDQILYYYKMPSRILDNLVKVKIISKNERIIIKLRSVWQNIIKVIFKKN